MITTWRLDLDRILQAFNVRSVISVRRLLTLRFQNELGTDTHITVSDVRNDVANTLITVSDVDSNALKNDEDTDNKNRVVGNTCTIPVIKQPLTTAQARTKPGIPTTGGSSAPGDSLPFPDRSCSF